MNRIGRIAIGGIIDSTAIKRAEASRRRSAPGRARGRSTSPTSVAIAEADERAAAGWPRCRPTARRRRCAGRARRRDGAIVSAISADRRQQLVVGIGGAPLRRAHHVEHRDEHERDEGEKQRAPRCGTTFMTRRIARCHRCRAPLPLAGSRVLTMTRERSPTSPSEKGESERSALASELPVGRHLHVARVEAQLHVGLEPEHLAAGQLDADRVLRLAPSRRAGCARSRRCARGP